jgi:hypothetical protein
VDIVPTVRWAGPAAKPLPDLIDTDIRVIRLAVLLAAQCAPSASGALRPLPDLIEHITG